LSLIRVNTLSFLQCFDIATLPNGWQKVILSVKKPVPHIRRVYVQLNSRANCSTAYSKCSLRMIMRFGGKLYHTHTHTHARARAGGEGIKTAQDDVMVLGD